MRLNFTFFTASKHASQNARKNRPILPLSLCLQFLPFSPLSLRHFPSPTTQTSLLKASLTSEKLQHVTNVFFLYGRLIEIMGSLGERKLRKDRDSSGHLKDLSTRLSRLGLTNEKMEGSWGRSTSPFLLSGKGCWGCWQEERRLLLPGEQFLKLSLGHLLKTLNKCFRLLRLLIKTTPRKSCRAFFLTGQKWNKWMNSS